MKRAKLIVIEGTDGSGKETQSKMLETKLLDMGLKVKRYSFPIYDSATGRIVGGPYLGKANIGESFFEETSANVDPLVSSLYYAADRRYNFLNSIESELYKNDVVILDRYTTSNLGHQAGKAKTPKERDRIISFITTVEFELCELPRPDKVIFLHMPFEAAKELRKGRKSEDGNENSDSHLINAEKTYVYIAKKEKWEYVKCLKTKKFESIKDIKSIDEISNDVYERVLKVLDEENVSLNKMTRF